MPHRIITPDLARVAWDISPHVLNHDVTDGYIQSISRGVGYDYTNRLFRFIKVDEKGQTWVSPKSGVSTLGYTDEINVPNSSTVIAGDNYNRKQMIIYNNGGADLYIRLNQEATTADGFIIPIGDKFETEHFTGTVYGITSAGVCNVRLIVIN